MQSLESTVNDSTERDNQAQLIQTYRCTAEDLQPWSIKDRNGHWYSERQRKIEKREQTAKGEPLMMIFFLLNLFWTVASLGNHPHLMSLLSLEWLFWAAASANDAHRGFALLLNSTMLISYCRWITMLQKCSGYYLQIVERFHFHDGATRAERETNVNGLIGAQRSQNLQRASRGETKTTEKQKHNLDYMQHF